MSTRKSKSRSQSKIWKSLTPELRSAVLVSMARKALIDGNTTAARIVLDAIDAQNGESLEAWNERALTIAELINNPVPDVDLEGLPEVENVQE